MRKSRKETAYRFIPKGVLNMEIRRFVHSIHLLLGQAAYSRTSCTHKYLIETLKFLHRLLNEWSN